MILSISIGYDKKTAVNNKPPLKEDSISLSKVINPSQSTRANRLNTASHNLLLLDTISDLIQKMHEHEIQVMLLKGAALLENIYPDISQRKMEDVDILVKPEKLIRTREILEEAGYRFYGTNQANSEVYTFDTSIKVYLDLHWSLVNQYSPSQKHVYWPDENLIWERAINIKLGQQTVLGMSMEDLLVYLCFHALKERFLHKKWLMDIKIILSSKKEEIDWDKFSILARDSGTDKLCSFIMEYLKKECGVDIPAVLSQIRKKHFFFSLEEKIFHFSMDNPMFMKELLWPLAMNSKRKQLVFFKNLPLYVWKKASGRIFIRYRK